MRRFLLICFLVVLPFQFAWGAAARYCNHESTPTAKHFGHHTHVHKAAADSESSSPAQADDADCDYCHLGCAQPLASTSSAMLAKPASIRISADPSPPRHRAASVIDKPNWFLAA